MSKHRSSSKHAITGAIVLFTIALLSSGFQSKDEIPWETDRRLTWKDFTPVKDNNSPYKALTFSGIRFKSDFQGDTLYTHVYSYFVKSRSWVKKGNEKPELLRHEQGHFDITEIYARRLRKKYSGLKITMSTFDNKRDPKRIEGIYKQLYNDMESRQDNYDKETDHGRDQVAQKRWDRTLARELKNLQRFSNP